MVVETETEALTGLSSMRVIVTEWASGIYDYVLNHLYILLFFLVVVVIIILIHALTISIQVKKAKKHNIESTNDWFDWKEFEAYEKKSKSNK